MCGISFIQKFREKDKVNINNILNSMRNRGPDDQQYKIVKNNFFAFSYLSITGDYKKTTQPYKTDNSLLIFNGVVISPTDNLDITAVNDHIIGKVVSGDLNAANIFLSGVIKWFYIETIFYPFNLLHLLLLSYCEFKHKLAPSMNKFITTAVPA